SMGGMDHRNATGLLATLVGLAGLLVETGEEVVKHGLLDTGLALFRGEHDVLLALGHGFVFAAELVVVVLGLAWLRAGFLRRRPALMLAAAVMVAGGVFALFHPGLLDDTLRRIL